VSIEDRVFVGFLTGTAAALVFCAVCRPARWGRTSRWSLNGRCTSGHLRCRWPRSASGRSSAKLLCYVCWLFTHPKHPL